jgi:antitoxin HicB
MKNDKRTYTLSIEEYEGGYLASFPALPGCHTWGKTYEDAVNRAEDALALYLETLAAHGDPIPEDTENKYPVSLGVTVRTLIVAKRMLARQPGVRAKQLIKALEKSGFYHRAS